MLCRTRSSNGSSQSAPSNGVDGALLVGSVMAWAPCDGRPAVALRVVSHQELTPPSPIPTNPATRPKPERRLLRTPVLGGHEEPGEGELMHQVAKTEMFDLVRSKGPAHRQPNFLLEKLPAPTAQRIHLDQGPPLMLRQ